jgi:trehalose 6-phosphate synthase/phosphatase
MSRLPLVVLSNRLPFSLTRDNTGRSQQVRSPGGLVSALTPALRARGGVWIGWPGSERDEASPPTARASKGQGFDIAEVQLSSREVAAYYSGFSNRTIWPLLHYFVGRMEVDSSWWSVYDAVNQRFAEAAAVGAGSNALVWIHDYQLLRVAHHLRAIAPHLSSALFLHVPFPAADVFRILPWSRELLHGMLSADYIGFHIHAFVRHFLRSAESLLGCDVDVTRGVVRYDGRDVFVGAHAISIDVNEAESLAGAMVPGRTRPLDAPLEILSVDRLDYTKGIVRRLAAIERVLEGHPARRLRFTQVLVPSRERVPDYSQLKREIDQAVGRVNGRFSAGGWSPVRYIARPVPREDLFAMYRQADIALVTPLRDGMNLVAKEYVASQVEDSGVLILSEMAGAAEELQEALIVNPFHGDAVVEAIQRAMSMPEQERRARMSALRARVRSKDVYVWVDEFLTEAERAAARSRERPSPALDEVASRLTPWLAERPRLALLLDYDGTLTPIVERPEAARLSSVARLALDAASRTPGIDIAIVSGRALNDVRDRVGLSNVTYVGNHGFEIEGPALQFRHEAANRIQRSMQAAGEALRELDIPGAQVELKGPTLTFHYRSVAEQDRDEVVKRVRSLLRRRRMRVVEGKLVLEGRPQIDWHKGHAVLWLLGQRYGDDWPSHVRALFIGDDTTDEDVFRSLKGIGRSICVGARVTQPATQADYRLPDPDAVIALIRWLTAGAFRQPALR